MRGGDPRDTTTLACHIGDGFGIVSAVSGDPVADCAAEWTRQTGTAAPPLAAYDNGQGGVLVQPASMPAPAGASPLPPGGQNVALIDLQESLDDYVAGLSSRCFAPAEAEAFARAELARVGFAGWSVESRANPLGATCVTLGHADPATRTVILVAHPNDPTQEQGGHVLFATKLREVATQCRPLAATRAAVEKAARDAGVGVASHGLQIYEVPTNAACTAIRLRVGGAVFVTLRGPA